MIGFYIWMKLYYRLHCQQRLGSLVTGAVHRRYFNWISIFNMNFQKSIKLICSMVIAIYVTAVVWLKYPTKDTLWMFTSNNFQASSSTPYKVEISTNLDVYNENSFSSIIMISFIDWCRNCWCNWFQ